jgi:hypothetical protein
MSWESPSALTRPEDFQPQESDRYATRPVCQAYQMGQCSRNPCPYRHIGANSPRDLSVKSRGATTPQSTSGGSPNSVNNGREPIILDIAEIIKGCRIPIRHVSEGPPPKTQTTSIERVTAPNRAKRDENSSCVFVIRGISKLGEDASSLIRSFFSRFGTIASLRFATPGRQGQADREFAPSVAFVVMSHSREVAAVLETDSYLIAGRRVQVEEYNRAVSPNPSSEDDAFDDMASSLMKSLEL